MRRIISLVISSLMVGVGAGTLVYLLEVGGWRGWMLMAAGFFSRVTGAANRGGLAPPQ